MAVPSTPTNFYVQAGDAQVLISWGIVAGATSYSVYRSSNGVTYASINTAAPTSFIDTTMDLNTLYYYYVVATNSDGDSQPTSPQQIVATLPGKECLASLRLQAQQRADRVGSNFVTLPEWNLYINKSANELYDLLTTVYEDYHLAPVQSFTTDGSTQLYDLPNGSNFSGAPAFYKLMGVDVGLATTSTGYVTLKKFDFISRNRYVFPQVTSTFFGVFNMQYRVVDDKIMFIPTPAAGQTIRLWYVPRMPYLLADTDVLDGVSGWTEYVIVDAAIKALQKEESDVSVLMAEKQMLIKRIEESAMNRDAGAPDTISNTRTRSERFGGFSVPGYDGSSGGW